MANAQQTGGSPQSQTNEVKRELGEDAERLKHKAAETAEQQAQQGKQQVKRTAEATSSAFQKAADELRQDDDAPDWLANAVSSAAKQVSSLADDLNDTSPREMMRATSRFARENPASFLTASAALGFAAARVFRAGYEYDNNGAGGSSDRGTSSTGGYGSSTGYGSGTGYASTGASRPGASTTSTTAGTTKTSTSGYAGGTTYGETS